MLDVYHRVSTFAAQLQAFLGEGSLAESDTVVIVGHAGTFSMLLARLLALDAEKCATDLMTGKMEIPNCSVLALDRFAVDSGFVYAPSAAVLKIFEQVKREGSVSIDGLDASPTWSAARQLANGRHTGVLWFNSKR
jgi:broad specificity phosphatase PhoE